MGASRREWKLNGEVRGHGTIRRKYFQVLLPSPFAEVAAILSAAAATKKIENPAEQEK